MHLRCYLPLFVALPSFEFVYATTASTRSGQARTVFERVSSRGRKWLTKLANPDRLHTHFCERQLFEKRETGGFNWLRLDVLCDDMQRFSGRHLAGMFARWEASGDEAIRAEIVVRKMLNGRFPSFGLAHDYDLFGRTEETS